MSQLVSYALGTFVALFQPTDLFKRQPLIYRVCTEVNKYQCFQQLILLINNWLMYLASFKNWYKFRCPRSDRLSVKIINLGHFFAPNYKD